MFEHWDAAHLQNIAQYGYFSPHSTANNVAFFPGYPATLAAAHLILRNWVLAELVVSGIAGCFAVVSLSRLAGGRRAVLYLLTTPAAIFLLVGYAECLFLAFAIPAWHAAARGRWWRAALLAGLSGLVRRTRSLPDPGAGRDGTDRPARIAAGERGEGLQRLAGPRPTRSTEGAHRHLGGRPGLFQAGWDLHLTPPVQALKPRWAALRHPFSASYSFEFQLELARWP